MTTMNSEAPRKKMVLLIEFDKFILEAHKRALQDIAIVKTASNVDIANRLIMSEFNNGTILILGGNQENRRDLFTVLELAVMLAGGNRFHPIIIANTGNSILNRELLNAGCTEAVATKKELPGFITNYRKSQSPRENRAAAFR